jgi:hypothetical protein
MSSSTNLAPFVFFVAAALLVVAISGTSPRHLPAADLPCYATLDPDTIRADMEPVIVTYAFSEDIGRLQSVKSPEDSRLLVASFDTEKKNMTLDASTVIPGDWQLTFEGQAQNCTGILTVSQES